MTPPAEATVRLPVLPGPVHELWHALMDLAEATPAGWTLIGGQMVLLHALEHQVSPPQVSEDGDVVANVRASTGAIRRVVTSLESAGFVADGMNQDHIAHRYVRAGPDRPIKIDVLAPEGLGPRSDLTTTRPGRTIQVPGGTQALDRTGPVLVIHDGRQTLVPRPSLLGALVLKAAACALPGDVSRHFRDVALLAALVPDPFLMSNQLSKKDRGRLRGANRLRSATDPAWGLVPPELRANGQIAFQVLTS
jgi:hypothetical protein